jgi:hypothetical protein
VLGIRQDPLPRPPPPPKTGKKRRKAWWETVPRMPYLFTGYHTYCIFKEFSLKLRPRKLRNLQLSSVRTAFLPLFLRARLHFSCIHSFHCLLFVPLSLLCNCGFCCGNLAKQVETVNAPFGELARSESRNLETRCAEAADRRPTLVISISFL